MAITKVYSAAYGVPTLHSPVNQNTGGVDLSYPLAAISSGLQFPASFCLSVQSKAGLLATDDADSFGSNWSLNVPRLNFQTKKIKLSNGSTHEIDTTTLKLKYHKLNDIIIERVVSADPNTTSTYIVKHKSGTAEYLDYLGQITRLVSTSGHCLDFTYEAHGGGISSLLSITDGRGTSISIIYPSRSSGGASSNTITVTERSPTTIKTTTLTLSRRSRSLWVLDSISLPNDNNAKTRFEYAFDEAQVWVSKIISPNGQVQKLSYSSISSSPSDTVRVVSKLEIMGEHQQDDPDKTTILYEYSEKNFTGYVAGTPQQPGKDNCLLRDSTYRYTVTEKHDDIQYLRTFNRFHLLESEIQKKTTGTGATTTTEYTYPLLSGSLQEQPANYSLWATMTTIFADAGGTQRVVTETRDFDGCGNLLSHRQTSGVTISHEYYPSAGDSNNCPAEPHGFIKFLKKTQVKPNDAPANKNIKTSEFKYITVTGLLHPLPAGGYRTANMVQLKTHTQNGQLLKTFTYVNANTPPATDALFVGMLASELSGSAHRLNYSYTKLNGNAIIQTECVAGELSTKTSSRIHPNSGKVLREIAANREETHYQYDSLDRIIQMTEFAGGNAEKSESYAYEHYKFINSTYKYQNTVTITTSSGMQYISHVNYAGLLSYSLKKQNTTTDAVCTRKIVYNTAGLVHQDIEYDTVLTAANVASNIVNTTQYIYDMRQLVEIRYQNGTKQYFTNNLVANTQTSRFQDGPTYVVTYNNFGLPISSKVITTGIEKLLDENAYDGFGRNVKATQFTRARMTTAYDLLDRVIAHSIKGKLDSDREDTTTYEYASAVQNRHLPVALNSITRHGTTENSIMASARDYDGLGRLTSQDRQQFTYDQPFFTTPSFSKYTNLADFSVTEGLDSITLQVDSVTLKSGPTQETELDYNFSLTTGELVHSSTKTRITKPSPAPPVVTTTTPCVLQYSYDNSGLTTEMTGLYLDSVASYLSKTYSLSGKRLTRSTNLLDIEEKYFYNSTGELVGINYVGVAFLTIEYNDNRRISKIKTFSGKFARREGNIENLLSVVYFEYDTFGFESQRKVLVASRIGHALMLEVNNIYNEDSVLLTRTIKNGPSASLQTKTYTYEAQYGQLKSSTTTSLGAVTSTVTYTHAGGNRLLSVAATGKEVETYTYQRDVLSKFEPVGRDRFVPIDAMGNILSDFEKRGIVYDALNRINKVTIDGSQDYMYTYDPAGRLCDISKGADKVIYVYDGDTLVGEINGTTRTVYLRIGDIILGRYVKKGTEEVFELYATDSTESVRCVKKFTPGNAGSNEISSVYYDYSDYGVRTVINAVPAVTAIAPTNFIDRNTLGFNGCLFDDVSNTYLLGNGYRAYSPSFRTFLSPDSLSPYGGAGVNRYQYCQLDPINNIDPSGHLSTAAQWGIGLGVASIFLSAIPIVGTIVSGTLMSFAGGLAITSGVLGVTSGALGIASGATEDNEELSRHLGYASLAFGVGSFATGLAANAVRNVTNFNIRAQQNIVAAENARLLKGRAYGALEYYPRFNWVKAEGAPFVTQTNSGWLESGGQLVDKLRPLYQGTGPVTLKSCYSAVGGTYASQAQRLANGLGRPVTGFIARASQGGSLGAVQFFPQTGFAAARTAALNKAGGYMIKGIMYCIRNPTIPGTLS